MTQDLQKVFPVRIIAIDNVIQHQSTTPSRKVCKYIGILGIIFNPAADLKSARTSATKASVGLPGQYKLFFSTYYDF